MSKDVRDSFTGTDRDIARKIWDILAGNKKPMYRASLFAALMDSDIAPKDLPSRIEFEADAYGVLFTLEMSGTVKQLPGNMFQLDR